MGRWGAGEMGRLGDWKIVQSCSQQLLYLTDSPYPPISDMVYK